MNNLSIFEIERDDDGMRLDRWLRKKFGRMPQAQVEKLARTGRIRVQGRRVKASTRLEKGQLIKVPSLGLGARIKKASGQKSLHHDPKDLSLVKEAEIYRDSDIIAINKPQGIAVQGGNQDTPTYRWFDRGIVQPRRGTPKISTSFRSGYQWSSDSSTKQFYSSNVGKSFSGARDRKDLLGNRVGETQPIPRRGKLTAR